METLAQLAAIVECSHDAIVGQRLDGAIETWNAAAHALYGYTAAEALGKSTALLLPPGREHEDREILEKIKAGERFDHFETVRVRRDGGLVDVSLTISPIRDLAGSIVGASHAAREITQRKASEGANGQLAAIVDSSEDAIISEDLHGRIQTWNASAQRIYGYSAEEIKGKNIVILMPAGRVNEEKEVIEKIRNGGRVGHFDTVRVRKDGTVIHVSLTISPIKTRAGVVVGASHVAREIAERRRLEAANAQLAAIVESTSDAIIGEDLNGIVQTWNAGATRIYGYTAEETRNHNISILLPPNRANEEEEILSKLRRGERVEDFVTVRRRKDGQLIEVSLTISPICDSDGRVVGASHVARDIRSAEISKRSYARRSAWRAWAYWPAVSRTISTIC
jgi:PAS domain S-box